MESELVPTRDAAVLLGCSEAGVRRWVRQGRLRGIRVGRALRIAKSDLDAIVARGTLDAPKDAGSAASTRSPLPWALRQAERYLAALDGDVELARECLDMLAARPVAECDDDRRRVGRDALHSPAVPDETMEEEVP
jgi:excisionase family DNA binding protein